VPVSGNDHAVVFAGSQFNFQLDAYKPVMLHDVLDLEQFLAEGLRSFNEHCAVGIAPNEERTKEHLDNLLMLALALNRL
jgi:fumarate hydratase class II